MKTDSARFVLAGKTLAQSSAMAGIGLRQQATPGEILALLDAVLSEAGLSRADLLALATLEAKAEAPALQAVATTLGVPLLALPQASFTLPVPNPSDRVAGHLGLSSVAEAAALAFGPLLVEKRRSANATCALSRMVPAYAAGLPSAASTASMLSTSHAGA